MTLGIRQRRAERRRRWRVVRVLAIVGAIAALAARDREGSKFVGGYGAVGVRTGGGKEATKA